MTHTKKLAVLIALLALLFVSCDWDEVLSDSLDYDLHGTWERSSGYAWGKIELDFYRDTIKISGYIAHLQDFAHDITLEAYTEDGNLYIKQRGAWQNAARYTRWHSGGYPRDEMLTLQGGDFPDEDLKRISN
ncbi:hypothetical protein FACS189485_14900 [Spirochaetia bacterium]|nr:hypothetical protein FACS189485_14900 [Spirochaetia bacterium]